MKTLYESIKPIEKEYVKSFVIIKPGFLQYSKEIIDAFAKEGWRLYKTTTKKLLNSESKRLYSIHKDKDFYAPLCKYMSSDLCRAFIFRKEGNKQEEALKEVEKLKDSLREKYGESDMRNVLHSSDTVEHMQTELSIFFVD